MAPKSTKKVPIKSRTPRPDATENPRKGASASTLAAAAEPLPHKAAVVDFAADLLTVTTTLAALPPLTQLHRDGFRQQISDERCDKAGVRTRAVEVFRDGVDWVPIIHRTLLTQSKAVRRYGIYRFVWLLTCLRELALSIEEQRSGVGSVEAVRRRAERAQEEVTTTREELLQALDILTGDDPLEGKALAKARGTTSTPESLAASLSCLAEIAEGWLKREEPVVKAMVEAVDLTMADVEQANRQAKELIRATSDASVEGKREVRDTPAVNRIEGRVLLEMQVVMDIFESANRRNKLVPKLSPGNAVRSFLGRKRPTEDEAPPETRSEDPSRSDGSGLT